MSLIKILAILKKQVKDTLKNKTVFIQFVMFPVFAIILENSIKIKDLPKNYFVLLFATMYIGMAPLTSMAEIIAEEKENNTLRILLMSNVKSWEYLLGTGIYIFAICMCGSLVFGLLGQYKGEQLAKFLLIMGIGIIISILVGAAIGTFSKNQMAATSLTVPIMMVFSFLPMISMFNSSIKKVSQFIYSQQISNLLQGLGNMQLSTKSIIIIAVNMLVMITLFTFAYKRCELA